MITTAASAPASPDRPNEDYSITTPSLLVVLDGATARTDTGCMHGPAWYARQLGAQLTAGAADHDKPLSVVLAHAITTVAGLHGDGCDLTHPGTPSAAVGMVRVTADSLEWLVLGDVTVCLRDRDGQVHTITDGRVSATASAERAEADRHPIGSAAKTTAMQAMKVAELAARNTDSGYWVAATNPAAAAHAVTGTHAVTDVAAILVCSDGAARLVDMTGQLSWSGMFSTVAAAGPARVLDMLRLSEEHDSLGDVWARNKASDDATLIYAEPNAPVFARHELPNRETRTQLAHKTLQLMNSPRVMGDTVKR